MKIFSINTLGCKVNQYEGQQVRQLLEQFGLHGFKPSEKPELVVVNTCCVTHIASAKSRQCIRKAQKLYPDAVIVVCGCLPVVQMGELPRTTKNIHFVKKRGDLVEILSQIVKSHHICPIKDNSREALDSPSCPNNTIKSQNYSKIKHKKELCTNQKLPQLTSFDGQTRAFLKIQDGCDAFCTYCIIPKTRPFVHSRPVGAILREAQALVRAGHKEIVITGIFLGAYGQKSVRRKTWLNQKNYRLVNLLEKVTKIPNLARIRLSSLEPADVTAELLDVFRKHPNIMPHLHLSLQSGSNAVLKKMCRQYKVDQVRETVELIKSRLDKPAITTDIIVGFPGETDADFEQTVNLAREIGFAKMHIFRFSPRKGTAAAKMQNIVDNQVIKKRSEFLRDLDIELGLQYRQQFLGKTAKVLLESQNGGLSGHSERYFMVNIRKTDKKFKSNDLINVRLIGNSKTGMIGTIKSE